MAIRTVGPNSTYPSIAAAMADSGPGDTIQLEPGYSNETATVLHSGMTITGEASSTGIVLNLGMGIATVTLAGTAPINLVDASDGNGIVANDGDNLVTVTAGADAVSGGLGDDRLFVDYRLATGAITGDSTSNVAEAGGGARLVTINGGFEHFTIWTGSGADTITTAGGDDDIRTGEGAGTITAGEGYNTIVTGDGADTITAGNGGNLVYAGNGTNTITTGTGEDLIYTGTGADTIVSGGGDDRITVIGGADTADAGAGTDLLIIDYSAAVTDVTGGVTGGDLAAGYTGHVADLTAATLDFVGVERMRVTTGSGNDVITTGPATTRCSRIMAATTFWRAATAGTSSIMVPRSPPRTAMTAARASTSSPCSATTISSWARTTWSGSKSWSCTAAARLPSRTSITISPPSMRTSPRALSSRSSPRPCSPTSS
jgi:Ca2+-binding RTX toxin-like protein